MLIIIMLIIGLILPFIVVRFIKPDGRYHCLYGGCQESFDTIYDLEKHLLEVHNYKVDWTIYD